jgi:prophage lp1 protein 6
MKTNTLARVNAIFGLISGIVLLLAPVIMFMMAVGAAAVTEDADVTVGTLTGFSIILSLVKIAVLVLGIVAIVYYKDDERVTNAPSVLLIVGGAVGLIPLLGWVGGILTIIGGSLYFGTLKKFVIEE